MEKATQRSWFSECRIFMASQTRLTMPLYESEGRGYILASEKGYLLHGCKGRPIVLKSAWKTQQCLTVSKEVMDQKNLMGDKKETTHQKMLDQSKSLNYLYIFCSFTFFFC